MISVVEEEEVKEKKEEKFSLMTRRKLLKK
jgi:hypothetical protein